MTLSKEELTLIHLIKLLSQADRVGLRLETEDLVITASRGQVDFPNGVVSAESNPAPGSVVVTPNDSPVPETPPSADETLAVGEVAIKAPIAGTFYSRPEPSAEPFCEVGSRVREKDTVCIIEVMKLFNSIPAGVSGEVRRIVKKDGESVQAGDALFIVGVE
ncbi:MAG: acetyl-CoA carboxylase biotin carboxyl carrier protein [Ectothiorhodospiraceae bacterium]|nr:acetyl-CoA carboxylase biotin carboxyl carrier protein [Ectothiorhodospiraceae bacterium]